jgi:arabinofuranosyltransferase
MFRDQMAPKSQQADYRKLILVVFAVELIAILVLSSFFFHNRFEDSYITYRYAAHLSQGDGLGAWNINGDKVEGFTSLAIVLLLAASSSAGINPEIASKALGIVSHAALCFMLLLIAYRKPASVIKYISPLILILSSLIMALYLPVAWYANSGMESVPFALLSAICLFLSFGMIEKPIFILLCVVTMIFRPEGIPFVLLLFLWHLSLNFSNRIKRAKIILNAGLFLISIICLFAFRFMIFGELLPNTYYAKVYGGGCNHFVFGLRDTYHWALTNPLWLAAFFVVLIREIRSFILNRKPSNPFIAFLLLIQFGFLGYNILIGGDNPSAFPFWRHQVHFIVVSSILMASAIQIIIPGRAWMQFLAIILFVVVGNFRIINIENGRMISDFKMGIENWPRMMIDPPNKYYIWLKEISDPRTTIASATAGELPYIVDAVHIDILGLNDKFIAHNGKFDPDGPVDSKTDMDYVLSLRPDIITLLSASFIKDGMNRNQLAHFRKQMILGMLDNEIFQNEYLFLLNGPYEYLDRAIFMHKSFWQNHPLRDSVLCIPVRETGIYK